MDYLVLGNLTVAVILAISGVAKLRAPLETRDAFQALRLPEWLGRSPAPLLLPWGELALAAILVLGGGWVLMVGAAASVLLFAAYSVVIWRALGFDEPVRCSCFGALGGGDVSRLTLLRNLLLLVTAVLGLAGAALGASVYGQPATSAGWVAMAALASAVVTLSLRGGESAAETGTRNRLSLRDLVITEVESGKRVQLGDIATRNGGVVLLFVMSGCGACDRVLRELPGLLAANPSRAVVPVRPADHGVDDPKWRQIANLHEDWSSNVAKALTGSFLPGAVELDARGTIVGSPVTGPDKVLELLRGTGSGDAPGAQDRAPADEKPAPPKQDAAGAIAPAGEEPLGAASPEPDEDTGVEDYQREEIPDAIVLRADGEPATLKQLASGQAQLLVAVNCRCAPARKAMTSVEEWRNRLPMLETRLMPSIQLADGEVAEVVAEAAVYDHGGIAAKALGATDQVAAVLLGADGLLAGGPVLGLEAVEEFVSDIEAQFPA